jgi:NTF2 fold immunity protein
VLLTPFLRVLITLLLTAAMTAGLPGHALSEELSRQGFTIPKDGFVPTADIAVTIAEAVLVPVYGKEAVRSERPFHAVLKGNLWIVTGTVPCEGAPAGAACPGGNADESGLSLSCVDVSSGFTERCQINRRPPISPLMSRYRLRSVLGVLGYPTGRAFFQRTARHRGNSENLANSGPKRASW